MKLDKIGDLSQDRIGTMLKSMNLNNQSLNLSSFSAGGGFGELSFHKAPHALLSGRAHQEDVQRAGKSCLGGVVNHENNESLQNLLLMNTTGEGQIALMIGECDQDNTIMETDGDMVVVDG